MIRTHLLAAMILAGAASASGVSLNLRGLPSPPASTSAGGITLTWTPGQAGAFTSGATRFGFDAASASDAPDLVDGGSGTAERIGFLFSTPVQVDSVVISQFGVGDAGTFHIEGAGTFTLANGVNDLGGVIAGAGIANFLTWTGANTSGAGLGFSVDGFNVQPLAPFSADFNIDGDVDGADFLAWQRGLGVNTPPVAALAQGNANFDARVNDLDLQVWQMQFGTTAEAAAVPELGSGVLMMAGLAIMCAVNGVAKLAPLPRRGSRER